MKKALFIGLLSLILVTGIVAVQKSHRTETPAKPKGSHTLTSFSCPKGLRAFYRKEYIYEFCYPDTWTIDLGDPADTSRVALGPKDDFRPLIVITSFNVSEIGARRALLLADAVIQQRSFSSVAGIRAEQLTFRALQGMTEQVMLFSKGTVGFSILKMEGRDEEGVAQVFDNLTRSFHFRPGGG